MICGRNVLFVSLMLSAAPALADECTQAQAVYADPAGTYELRFEPVGSEAAVTSNHFKIRIGDTGLLLDGVVMQSGEPLRANGIVMNDCPTGDVTGAELEACTVWQARSMRSTRPARSGCFSQRTRPAADRILLPGFRTSLRESSAWGEGKGTTDSSDVFQFKGVWIMSSGPVLLVTGGRQRHRPPRSRLPRPAKAGGSPSTMRPIAMAAEDVVRRIAEAGGTAVSVEGDVGRERGVKAIFAAVDTAFGRLDGLVNNARDHRSRSA